MNVKRDGIKTSIKGSHDGGHGFVEAEAATDPADPRAVSGHGEVKFLDGWCNVKAKN